MQPAAGKQLFAHPYRQRRRRPGQQDPARAAHLPSGQALAEAQRLSRPRLRGQVFVLLLMCADLMAVLASGGIAHLIVAGLPPVGVPAIAEFWIGALVALAAIRAVQGYRRWRMRLLPMSLGRMVMGLGVGLAAALAVHGLLSGIDAPTLTRLAVWAGLAGVGMALARGLVWQRMRALTRLGVLEQRLVVVGGGSAIAPTLRALDQCRAEGYRVCGFFDERTDTRSPVVVAGHHKTGDLRDLVAFVQMAQIDTVIVAVPDLTPERQLELLAVLSALPVEVRTLAGSAPLIPVRAPRSRIGQLDLVELCRPPLTDLQRACKRAFDIVTATLSLVLLAPVLLGVALAVRLDSPGPVLFRQTRHGFNTKPITVLKFRSMYVEACDPSAVRAVRRGDDRVTRVGRFIRRTSLDELPQLFNVLAGTLSMVGPRPHATAARTGDILYDEVARAYSARHRVKPGITGWAQVNGWRGEMNSAEKIRARIEHDLYYVENWSLWFDLRILLMTPAALIRPKNAY